MDGDRLDQRAVLGEFGGDDLLVAIDVEAQGAILAPGTRHPGDDHRRADVAAHGVNRDAWAHVHAWGALGRDDDQDSVETTSRPL